MTAVRLASEPASVLAFTVDGTPQPQGSKRHVGKGILVESSKEARPWRERVAREARAAELDSETREALLVSPVHVELLFRFTRPRTHYGTGRNVNTLKKIAPDYKASRPDIDKLARCVLDGLTEARIFRDDSQVAVLVCDKRYAERPGLQVRVRPLGLTDSL